MSDDERPLFLRLCAGPNEKVLSLVLKENETGEVNVSKRPSDKRSLHGHQRNLYQKYYKCKYIYFWFLLAVGCVQFSRAPELPAHSAAGRGGLCPADRAAVRLGARQDERSYEELQYAWLKRAAC